MPIENERKFVLKDDGKLEAQLASRPGVSRNFLRQAYLDAPGLRIRSIEADGKIDHVFTYKRTIDGQVVEIETGLSAADFARLWTQRIESLQKVRYSWGEGRFHWDIDFFRRDDGSTYFAMAEVEMPEEDTEPPPLAGLSWRSHLLVHRARLGASLEAHRRPGACHQAPRRDPRTDRPGRQAAS
jgi:CYTH domain-containing protein